jgi:hypothetical protein
VPADAAPRSSDHMDTGVAMPEARKTAGVHYAVALEGIELPRHCRRLAMRLRL